MHNSRFCKAMHFLITAGSSKKPRVHNFDQINGDITPKISFAFWHPVVARFVYDSFRQGHHP